MANVLKKITPVLALIMMALLSSCSHMSKKDGPPNYYVDVSKIPNAVPKPEPLSKYGNMRSYSVFGKRYYPLKSSNHFEQVGVASWYGTKFHSRRTSSGEPYDMLAMTAAHKTLPLPTYVEVTNLRNNKKIIVKVNDRGPFASSRIIDLSYVAARKLEIVGHGTSHVRLRAIDPYQFARDSHYFDHRLLAQVKKRRTYTDYLDGSITLGQSSKKRTTVSVAKLNHKKARPVYLQMGVFRHKSNALTLKQQLNSVLASPVKVTLKGRQKFLVHVGPLKDVATANRVSLRLKRLGFKPLTQK
jgi:rare lipoprotein A